MPKIPSRESSENPRPNPRDGLSGAQYAGCYVDSHREDAASVTYRAGYADVVMLDGLMAQGYRLLDIGCGTGGYHRLLTRHGHVHGIDPIAEMIAAANAFRTEFGLRGCEYTCATFEDLASTQRYDAVRACGVYGWYLPWTGGEGQAALSKIASMLTPSGVAALTYVPPDSPAGYAKALLAPRRTVVLRGATFKRMLVACGLEPLFDMRLENAVMVFAKKTEAGR